MAGRTASGVRGRAGALALLCALMCGVFAGRAAGGAGGDPDSSALRCAEPVYAWGTVSDDQPVRHVFALRNTGTAPVRVAGVVTGCGCTATKLRDRVIEPGEATDLAVTLDVAGMRGEVKKTITVTTDGPGDARLVLTMTGTVKPEVLVSPGVVAMGEVAEDAKWTGVVTLTAGEGTPGFHVLSASSDHPGLAVRTRTIAEGRSYEVTVAAADRLVPGRLSTRVRVRTDHPRRPEIAVPVTGTVLGPLRVSPTSVVLNARSKEPQTAFVYVSPGKVTKFTVESVTPPAAGVVVAVSAVGEAG